MIWALLACSSSEHGSTLTVGSSSIVWAWDALWLTSPDDDQVVEVDPDTLEVVSRVSVPGAPEHLARVGDRLLVTLSQASEVAWVDGDVQFVEVPCGGTRGVVAADGVAWVTCPHDDRLLKVEDTDVTVLASPGRPTAIAMTDDRIAVSMSRRGAVRILDRHTLLEVERQSLHDERSAVQIDAIAASSAGFVGTWQRVEHDDRTVPPEDGGYGSVVDGNPRIEPRLWGACGDRYARFDGGARVMSGPSAVAVDGDEVWVVNQYTDNVGVFGCDETFSGSFRVGRGPRGIVVREGVAWVDGGFGHSVARLERDSLDGSLVDADDELRRDIEPTRLSEAALLGRSLFHDAVDTHLTPSGIVTCATCHPAGGEDGLSWFLHTDNVPRKVRRTPPAWAARPGALPFHWDGEFTDGGLLSQTTIRELMEGDGLLVDTDAIAAWMAESPIPLGRPSEDAEAEDRGASLFAERCASCHAGVLLTDADLHAVVALSADEDAAMEAVNTPSLRAVRARPPYLHDGRAATLRAVLTDANPDDSHGVTSDLDDTGIDALLAYLQTL